MWKAASAGAPDFRFLSRDDASLEERIERIATRVYGADAYRAAFALCLLLAAGAFVSACLAPETRCRNIWSAA